MQKKILFNKEELEYIDSLWVDDKIKNFDNRFYMSCFLQELTITTKLLKWFEEQTGEKLKHYNLNLILHRYQPGCYFGKHVDNGINYNRNRLYTIGFHLISEYEGGEYILYNPHSIVDKTPGVPYLNKASIEHEVTPITNGLRKSALIFIEINDLIKKNLV
jgi:Rps23 Pro-64 3,4-dihydroxylase Tpa1-like proline 4-hydroxylase